MVLERRGLLDKTTGAARVGKGRGKRVKTCTVRGCCQPYGHLEDHVMSDPARQAALIAVLAALNGDDDAISLDRQGLVFDALLGEYGTVILSNEQLNALIDVVLVGGR